VAASYCKGDKCYENAQGFNIWIAYQRPTDNLKRITADRTDIRRFTPFFGKDENDLYWVTTAQFVPSEHVHTDVLRRFLVHGPNDDILFPMPDPAEMNRPNALRSEAFPSMSMYPAGMSSDGAIVFTSEVFTNRSKGPWMPAIKAVKSRSSIPSVLFRYANGAVTTGSSSEVNYAAASRVSNDIILLRHAFIPGRAGSVSDFYLLHDGQETPLFRFDSWTTGVAASDDLGTVVFAGTRGLYGQSSLWVWHKGDAAPTDLNAPERVKEQCDQEIAAEKARAPHP
jgi:hypothetical protein